MVSTKHLLQDCIQGFIIVILALAAFLGYVSLREQLLQGAPAWLERDARADIFNIFGVANGGLGAAVFGEGNEEPAEPQVFNNDGQRDGTVQQSAVNVAPASSQSSFVASPAFSQEPQAVSSTSQLSTSRSEVTGAATLGSSSSSPQQLAWYAEEPGLI
ncbi:unnamed protein product [Heterobilharzia americana]|nr:unnamed protein product [Heterobilharzia americana]